MIASQVRKLSASILYLAAESNYTRVHFADNQSHIHAVTLGTFELVVPGFVRIHKSYLINPAYVTDARYKGAKLIEVLVNEQWLPVSRRRAETADAILRKVLN